MATPLRKNPCPGGHEIYNFGRPFLGHHYYILNLSDIYIGGKKKIMHFHNMTCMATPQRKNPCPGVHEIYNLGRPFFDHHYYALIFSETCP